MLNIRYSWDFWVTDRRVSCREREEPFLPCFRGKGTLQSCKASRTPRTCGLCYGQMAKEVGGWQGLADTSHSVSAGGKTKVRIGKACISRQEYVCPAIVHGWQLLK